MKTQNILSKITNQDFFKYYNVVIKDEEIDLFQVIQKENQITKLLKKKSNTILIYQAKNNTRLQIAVLLKETIPDEIIKEISNIIILKTNIVIINIKDLFNEAVINQMVKEQIPDESTR